MSTSITARDLRTLRRLARTTALFPSTAATTFTVRFALGGESLTPRARRRLRRSLQNLSKSFGRPATVFVAVRYGRSERRRRQLFHPHFIGIRSLLQGEIIRVERSITFLDGSSFSATDFAKFLADVDGVLKTEGISFQKVGSQTSGPSARILISGTPFSLVNSVKRDNLRAIRPLQVHSFLSPLPDFTQSILKTLNQATYRSLEAVTKAPHQSLGAFAGALESPLHTLLNLLAYRVHQF